MSSESWRYEWPVIEKKYLEVDNVTIVVQFNGKKRGIFNTKKDTSEENLVNEIINSKDFDKKVYFKVNKYSSISTSLSFPKKI